MQEFEEILNDKAKSLERIIQSYLPAEEGAQKTVIEAMNYSVLAGGKRLRPLMMQETYKLFGGKDEIVEPFMAAIEMIHTYSLVHDDLPAMDNDDYRRGTYTTWKKYGEAMGILAGDGLLNFAFETALKAFDFCEDETQTKRVVQALKILSEKAGIYGMIGGQTADVEGENAQEDLSLNQILFIHAHKTAALIEASMMVGAVLAGAGKKQLEDVRECAYNIGVAFQIQDDILDVVGDSKELGKTVGSDENNHKQTYVSIKGMDEAANDVELLSCRAIEILEDSEGDSDFLKELVLWLINRRK